MITTLLFDWGGVLTVGRYTRAILNVLSKEKPISIEDIYPDFDQFMIQMNEGTLSGREFVIEINKKFHWSFTEKEIDDVFRKAIVPNEEIITLLPKLRSRYTLVLFSDNDEITLKNLKRHHHVMLELFDKKYFSHELKLRKPNLQFFKYVLRDLQVPPLECLFIDDKQKNVEAAIACGMQGVIFSSAEQLKKELIAHGIPVH